MAKVTRQRIAGILEAKGYSSAQTTAGGRVACIFSGFAVNSLGPDIEVCYASPFAKAAPLNTIRRMAQAYLAALTAAGIECRLAEDGRTVIVEVEREGS